MAPLPSLRLGCIGRHGPLALPASFWIDQLQMSKKALATDLLASEEDSSELSGTKPTLEDFKILLGQ